MTRPKPVVLAILDGWGENPAAEHNAIRQALTPTWNRLTREYPHGQINASELSVGLPEGQMGNSEVGHMNIGAGRVVMQDLPRIDAAIQDGSLAKNAKLLAFIAALRKSGGACHLMGLLSPGGVHSHEEHLIYLSNLLNMHGINVWTHLFLDGRDTPPRSAGASLENHDMGIFSIYGNTSPEVEMSYGWAKIATVSGRYYAMDRDKRWDRIEKAYQAIALGKGPVSSGSVTPVKKAYAEGLSDEFVIPTVNCTATLNGVESPYSGMRDGDGLLMANFRADRAREMLTALLDPAFKEFPRKKIAFAAALGMVEYSAQLNPFMEALFPPEPLTNILPEIIARAGMTQLRIAETEKYAHVTFFFNGGREEEFPGEERILIPSPKVATYDMKPEMSAHEVTDQLLQAIAADKFDFIVVNYANTDMVGHTGDIGATIKAVEAVDACLDRLSRAVLAKGGALIITADHGNAENMFDAATGQAHTAHTLNLVPALIVYEAWRGRPTALRSGKLADIAPTVLHLLGLPQPAEMTGTSLLRDMT